MRKYRRSISVFLPRSAEPPKRLVAFEKVWLNPGEKRKIQISIDPSSTNHPLGYWDSGAQDWANTADGQYQVYVGNSAPTSWSMIRSQCARHLATSTKAWQSMSLARRREATRLCLSGAVLAHVPAWPETDPVCDWNKCDRAIG